MTAKISELVDGGPNPNTPSVAEMRESQRVGSVGTGTQSESYADMQACFNMGTGKGVDEDKPSYPTQSNDPDVSEVEISEQSQPWE
jgi:hypothetical protein